MLNQTQAEIVKFLEEKAVLLSQNDGNILTIKLGFIQSNNEVKILTSTSIKL